MWETPTQDKIIELTAHHVAAMETMTEDIVWQQAGMHHVLIRTIGRKSGKEHKIALPAWIDAEGVRVVVASFAGAKNHPSWLFNIRDRDANPEVHCTVQTGAFWSVPEVLEGGDAHQALWDQLTADRAWYNNYQAKTERTIPLVRLPESRPA